MRPSESRPDATNGIARRALIVGLLAAAGLGITIVMRRPGLLPAGPDGVGASARDEFVAGLRKRVPDDSAIAEAVTAATEALRAPDKSWADVPSVLNGIASHSFEEALAVIRRACRADYEAGRTLSVIGWEISRTEAELITLLG